MLPKTGIYGIRKTDTNALNPADGVIINETITIPATTLIRVVDASGVEYDRFFDSGSQGKKRYLFYFGPEHDIKLDDEFHFNEKELGLEKPYVFDPNSDVKVILQIPPKRGTIPIFGSIRVEAYMIASN